MGEMMQADLAKVGVKVKLVSYDSQLTCQKVETVSINLSS